MVTAVQRRRAVEHLKDRRISERRDLEVLSTSRCWRSRIRRV